MGCGQEAHDGIDVLQCEQLKTKLILGGVFSSDLLIFPLLSEWVTSLFVLHVIIIITVAFSDQAVELGLYH